MSDETDQATSAPARRRGRSWLAIGLLVVAVGAVGARLATVLSAGPPNATVSSLVADSVGVPGTAPAPSWPAEGEAAVAIPSLDVAAQSPTQHAVPIGSITKLMTAWVVLKDHPLSGQASGPSVTVTAADVASWQNDLATDQSNVAIASGETLTERQLLEGLLIHSGNDYAQILAEFDDGSIDAFVSKMNEEAAALHLGSTHYADASGYSPLSVSTPADQVRLASTALENPTIRAIVSQTSVTLPVAGTVDTYTPFDGVDGVIGVKSGLTSQAGGCDLLAIEPVIAGARVLVLSAVTGQSGANNLTKAGFDALFLAKQAAGQVRTVPIATTVAPVGTVGWGSRSTSLYVTRHVQSPAWPGATLHVDLAVAEPHRGRIVAGSTLGSIEVASGSLLTSTPLEAAGDVSPPGFFERVV